MKRVLIVLLLIVLARTFLPGLQAEFVWGYNGLNAALVLVFILFMFFRWRNNRTISDTESADGLVSREALSNQPDGLFSDDEEED